MELQEPPEPPLQWTEGETHLAAEDARCLRLSRQVIYDAKTTKVYRPHQPDRILGWIKRYDEGRPKDRYFLTCKLHKSCCKIVPARLGLPEELFLQWFELGETIPSSIPHPNIRHQRPVLSCLALRVGIVGSKHIQSLAYEPFTHFLSGRYTVWEEVLQNRGR